MKKIKYPIIVEGKYDKIKITSLFDATVVTTNGFAIFNEKEKVSLIRKLADNGKIIILTDSDGAGHMIRAFIKTAVSPDKIINLYTPSVEGKEKRKRDASREGLLGVEGIDADKLREILSPFTENEDGKEEIKNPITKSDLYALGLSGRDNSSALREKLLKKLNLPHTMTPNAMLEALNILYSKEYIENLIKNEE